MACVASGNLSADADNYLILGECLINALGRSDTQIRKAHKFNRVRSINAYMLPTPCGVELLSDNKDDASRTDDTHHE